MAAYARECASVEAYNRRQQRQDEIEAIVFGLVFVVGVPLATGLYILAYLR